MKKEELLVRFNDKQKGYDWSLLPEEFTYATQLQYICHKKDELGNEHGVQNIKLGKILRGDGCPLCRGKHMTKELFVYKANTVHNNSYVYDEFDYVNKNTKGFIYCPKHNIKFNQTPLKHLSGQGCPKCRYEKSAASNAKDTEYFVNKAVEVWGDKYVLSNATYKRCNKKICIGCRKHGDFWITPMNFISGQGCPICGKESSINSRKMSFKEFCEIASEVHNGKYKYYEDEYAMASELVGIECPIHGKFYQKGTNHIDLHQGCPKCSNQQSLAEEKIVLFLREIIPNAVIEQRNRAIIKPYEVDIYIPSYNIAIEYNGLVWHSDKFNWKEMNRNKIKSTEDFINKAREIFGERYIYAKTDIEKKDSKRRVTITCPKHGDFLQNMYSHLKGCGCPKCGKESSSKTKTLTNEQFVDKANIVHNFKYLYDNTVYNCATDYVDITCPIHGVFRQKAYSHLQGHGCQKCAVEQNSNNMMFSKEDFIEKANIIHKNTEDYSLVQYKGAKIPVEIICKNGHHYWQIPNKHLLGHSCPYCNNNISKQKEEITDFIKEELNTNVDNNNRKILSDGKELDLYLPSRKTAIEHNGVIWHSEKYCKDKYYHLKKTEDCLKQGIRLIHIFEDEWLYKQDIVKSKIMEILNCSPNKIQANDCEIKEVPTNECNEFLEHNSISNIGNSSIKYGCFYENKLVSLMTFKNVETNSKYELTNYCNKLNTSVIGGEKALFKHFICNTKPTEVIAKVDRRWNSGDNLKDLGFKFVENTKPKFYYVYGRRRYNKIDKETIKGKELYRIWDCGNAVFKLKTNK